MVDKRKYILFKQKNGKNKVVKIYGVKKQLYVLIKTRKLYVKSKGKMMKLSRYKEIKKTANSKKKTVKRKNVKKGGAVKKRGVKKERKRKKKGGFLFSGGSRGLPRLGH